jgi:hypothetical protein
VHNNNTVSFNTPAGFAVVTSNVNADVQAVFSKTLTGTDISNGYVTIAGQSFGTSIMLLVSRGLAVNTALTSVASAVTTAALTPATYPGYEVSFVGGVGNTTVTITGWDGPGGQFAQQKNSGSFADWITVGWETTSSGSFSSRTVTASSYTHANRISLMLESSGIPVGNFTQIALIVDDTAGLQPRTTATATTSSIAAGAVDSATNVALAKTYRLLAVQTSRPARVRLYNTTAKRTADAGRAVGTDPVSDTGVMFEFVTVDTAVHTLSPLVDGTSMETVPSATIPMSVTNNDTVTGTVAVTFTWQRIE